MMPWAHTFDIYGLTDLSQYFAIFELFESTTNGRKFLRGLRELHERVVAMISARSSFRAAAVTNPGPPADRASSNEDSENGDQDFEGVPDQDEQGTRPPVSSSSAPIGDVVRNEKKVRDYLAYFMFPDLSS
jgi:hypothetical protein